MVFCIFCGGPAFKPWLDDDADADDEFTYDRNILKPDDMQWMDDVRLLGYNPDSPCVKKTYLTGRARHWDFSLFDWDRGGDPSVPQSDDLLGVYAAVDI